MKGITVSTMTTGSNQQATKPQYRSVTGNLTADPDMRYTPSGKAVSNFTIAVNHAHRDQHGQWIQDDPEYIKITAWEGLAEQASANLVRGMRVIVNGKSAENTYVNRDGEPVTENIVVASDIGTSIRYADVTVRKVER